MDIRERFPYTVHGYYRFPIVAYAGFSNSLLGMVRMLYKYSRIDSVKLLRILYKDKEIFCIQRKKEGWIRVSIETQD